MEQVSKILLSFENPIWQQNLKRCRIRTVPCCNSIAFCLISILYAFFFCYFGLSAYFAEVIITEYDNICLSNLTCHLDIEIPNTMNPPVFLYYKVTNFLQNHIDIASSYNSKMLRGDFVSETKDLESCNPYIYVNDSESISNILVPCGKLSQLVFNDTFTITDGAHFSDEGIALRNDLSSVYQQVNSNYSRSNQSLENTGIFPKGIQNEHYIVWMRNSPFGSFWKLYAKSNEQILAGTTKIDIQNRFLTESYDGKKYIILSEQRNFGTSKIAPCIIFGTMSVVSAIISLLLAFTGWVRQKPDSNFHPAHLDRIFEYKNS